MLLRQVKALEGGQSWAHPTATLPLFQLLQHLSGMPLTGSSSHLAGGTVPGLFQHPSFVIIKLNQGQCEKEAGWQHRVSGTTGGVGEKHRILGQEASCILAQVCLAKHHGLSVTCGGEQPAR